jgi:hypothetical protein
VPDIAVTSVVHCITATAVPKHATDIPTNNRSLNTPDTLIVKAEVAWMSPNETISVEKLKNGVRSLIPASAG